jgi:hypothetical protein
MTATLTDRYVWAVQRSLPEAQRADIDRELRGTIADTIDGRREAGTDEATAERETLVELGDPYRLAAGYADRPLHLIGPAVFPDYIRLLKVLYVIVLPIVFAAILLGQLIGQPESVGGAIGSAFGAIIAVAAHLGFWTTLVFALIERSPQYKAVAWKPETLPQLPATGAIKLSDTVASVVWFVFLIGALIWSQFFSLFRDATGAVIPVLDQDLWRFWLPVFVVLAVLEVALKLWLYRLGRWTLVAAAANAVIALGVIIPTIWLFLNDGVVNSRFAERAHIGALFESDGVVTIVALVVILATGTATIVDGFVKAVRQAPAGQKAG